MNSALRFLALALVGLLCVGYPAEAGHRGNTSVGASSLLAPITVVNTSGSTQPADFVASILGHPFKKGDIPNGCTGGAPKFELTNGTNVPFSEGLAPTCWNDGSLREVPFMFRIPSVVAGSGNITINVKSGGTTPTPSSRTLADFATAGTDLNMSVTGLDNLSGVWVSNLNQGIAAAHPDDYVYMDGQAGKVWRVRASFRQSGADHGQLEAYWYIQSLQDPSGGLAGLRVMATINQPWYNIDSPAKNWRSFSAWTLNNGGTVIRDFFGPFNGVTHFGSGAAANFTWASGSTLNSTANGLTNGYGVRFTTTGSLPTGLNTGQTYFVENPLTNSFSVGTNSKGVGTITPTGACTGTCTATAYPFITQFSRLNSAGSTGKYDYIQAGGSVAADDTTRFQFNTAYWRSTRMVPPYLLGTYTPTAQTLYTHFPMTTGPVETNTANVGERNDLGELPDWFVRHFYRQDANGEATARTIGLVYGLMPTNLRNKTTFTMPVVNNTQYTGMPAPNTNFLWRATAGSTNGFTAPTDTNVLQASFNAITMDHMPDLVYYPLLVFGEPQFNDMLNDQFIQAMVVRNGPLGQSSIINGTSMGIGGVSTGGSGKRDAIVFGTHYYGINLNDESGIRAQAWTARNMGTSLLAGAYEPAGVETRRYERDTNLDTYAAYMAYISHLPTFAQDNGFWGEPGTGNVQSWEVGYYSHSLAFAIATNELGTNAIAFLSHLMKMYTWINNTNGTWWLPWYTANFRVNRINVPTNNSQNNPYITSADLWGNGGAGSGQFSGSWVNGTPTFTLTGHPSNYAPANGDNFFLMDGNVPSAMTIATPYFMQNVSGNTFEITPTKGGGVSLVNTDSGSSINANWYIGGYGHPLTSNMAGGGAGSGYTANIAGAVNFAIAVGATVDPALAADINANLAAVPNYILQGNASPKWTTGANY